jgi:filamentous hemagglutinin
VRFAIAHGVPPTDANYRLLSDMQAAGETNEYAAERSTLTQQTYRVGTNPGNQASPLKLFNDYNASDSVVDAFTSSNGGIRTMGLLQALDGTGMIAAGTGACTTGLGCFLGGAGATLGLDQLQAGAQTAATGKPTLTMGEQALQGLGLSPQAAALTYAALGLSPAAVEGILLNQGINVQAAAYAAARKTYATNGVNGANGGVRIESLAANDVRFYQNTVSYNKVDRVSGEKYTYDDLVQSMKTGGWKGDPVDVVKMPDGAFTSMDNTRISAARDAGIKVQANVHGFNDPLPADMIAIDRFGDAKTWGEALAGRISNQKPPSFGNANPNGSPTAPRITGRP